MREAANDEYGIDPAKLTLEGHGGDPRSLLAFRILTHQLSDLHAMATCPDAVAILEALVLKFPE